MSEKDIDVHEALIGSQVRCIKNYLSDFLQAAPECKYWELDGCNHPDAVRFHCAWDCCPLK